MTKGIKKYSLFLWGIIKREGIVYAVNLNIYLAPHENTSITGN